jgi:aspartate aminotransferase/aminotransferase
MISNRMQHLDGSGMRRIFELAGRMNDPIDLSLGQAHFGVPDAFQTEMIKAVREGHNGYSVASGIPPLRERIDGMLRKEGIDADSIMITAGASGGLVTSLMALVNPGDEVLIPDPYFATYKHIVRLAGGVPRLIDTYPDFRLTPDSLRAAASQWSRLLLFNSPVNPTGVAYRADEIRALAKTAKELGLQVIADEVYDAFSFDHPHVSWLNYDTDAVLIRAFSKTFGMAGWRIGFAAGPKEILDHMITLQQFTFVCANAPAQWACVRALDSDDASAEYIESYRKKRDFVADSLSVAFDFHRPEGAFYLYPEYPDGNGERFMARCMEREVLVVPGSVFSERDTHFRISFAADEETLKRGVNTLIDIAAPMPV